MAQLHGALERFRQRALRISVDQHDPEAHLDRCSSEHTNCRCLGRASLDGEAMKENKRYALRAMHAPKKSTLRKKTGAEKEKPWWCRTRAQERCAMVQVASFSMVLGRCLVLRRTACLSVPVPVLRPRPCYDHDRDLGSSVVC